MWSSGFDAKTSKKAAQPVYMMIFPRTWGETRAAYEANETDFEMETLHNFEWNASDRLFIYDNSGWEIILPTSFYEDGGYDVLANSSRGISGTPAQAFAASSRIINPHMILSTHEVSDCTLDHWPVAQMPSGHSCSLLYQEGRNQVSGVSFTAIDHESKITKKFNNWFANGKPVVILGGYQDLPFYAFTILYTGSIKSVSYVSGSYKFDISADFDKLNQTLFGDIEDFSGRMTVDGMPASETTLTLLEASWPFDAGTSSVETATGKYAAIYLKIEDEILRLNGSPTVVRGQLGTTAASHGQHVRDEDGNDTGEYVPVDMFFSIQGNPVDILLYFLISGGTAFTDQGSYDLYLGDDNDDPVGVRWPVSSIDVTGFQTIRDAWYPSDVYRIDITERQKMRELLEDNILKPMNANLFIDRSGKLGLATIVPAIPTTYVELTEADIVGAPNISLDAENLLNDVLVKYDYDAFEDEYKKELRLINATSQSDYDKAVEMVVEARGVHPIFGGETLARNIANNKLRNFKDLQAVVSFSALFNKGAEIEPGSSVRLTHSQLPDTNTGQIGFDYYLTITSKKINWGTGKIDFEGIKTNFAVTSRRTALIAPTGTADYDAATDAVKDRYAFVSADTGLMADGTTGYAWS